MHFERWKPLKYGALKENINETQQVVGHVAASSMRSWCNLNSK
jgi:hypothetical protein